MAFWNWKSKQKSDSGHGRPTRQLRMMAEEGVGVEFQHLDDEGKSSDVGRCKVWDYDEREDVLVIDVPTLHGRPMPVDVGHRAKLLFELRNAIFKFETEVLERFIYKDGPMPMPALKVRAPDKLDSGSKRETFRVEPMRSSMPTISWQPVYPHVEEGSEDEPVWREAGVRDVSARGLGIYIPVEEATLLQPIYGPRLWSPIRVTVPPELADSLLLTTRVKASILLPAAEEPILVDCIVRGIFPGQTADQRALGLEFDLPEGDTHEEITQFVLECQREIARARSGQF